MHIIKKIISNGYSLIIPVLLWNFFLTKFLPGAYQMKSFNANIPSIISTGEFIGRVLVFGLPLFIQLNFRGTSGKAGLLIYLIGILFYFLSWILLITVPQSPWSKSIVGFTAPAFTIVIWLIGFALLSDTFYFKIPYSKWYFIISTLFMTGFHFTHAYYVWHRIYH